MRDWSESDILCTTNPPEEWLAAYHLASRRLKSDDPFIIGIFATILTVYKDEELPVKLVGPEDDNNKPTPDPRGSKKDPKTPKTPKTPKAPRTPRTSKGGGRGAGGSAADGKNPGTSKDKGKGKEAPEEPRESAGGPEEQQLSRRAAKEQMMEEEDRDTIDSVTRQLALLSSSPGPGQASVQQLPRWPSSSPPTSLPPTSPKDSKNTRSLKDLVKSITKSPAKRLRVDMAGPSTSPAKQRSPLKKLLDPFQRQERADAGDKRKRLQDSSSRKDASSSQAEEEFFSG